MVQIDIELAKLKETKANIAQSITAKGGTLSSPSDFSSYSVAVENLPTTVTDFSVIGYTSVPEPFNSGIEYAKQIKDSWDPTKTSISYYGDTNLYLFPVVDTSNVKSIIFADTPIMCAPTINTSSVTSVSQLFRNCQAILVADLSSWDLSKVTNASEMFYDTHVQKIILPDNFGCANMSYAFSNCNDLMEFDWTKIDMSKVTNADSMCYGWTLPIVPELDTSNCTNMKEMFGSFGCAVTRLEGIDCRGVFSSLANSSIITTSSSNSISYMVLKNLGFTPTNTTYTLTTFRKWGIATDDNPDAKQSLIDSLITYSVDRTGMSTATIKLYSSVKALLTADEIAQIEAKNYTIS